MPEMKDVLLETDGAIELPVLRGRTLVPSDWEGTVVLGHPNYFGRFEPVGPGREEVRLTGTWSALRPVPPTAAVVAMRSAVSNETATASLEAIRRLSKRLKQLPGVALAVRPQSPVLIVLTPDAVMSDGPWVHDVSVLGGDFPEFPGGIRIEMPTDVTGSDLVRYADDLERRLTKEM